MEKIRIHAETVLTETVHVIQNQSVWMRKNYCCDCQEIDIKIISRKENNYHTKHTRVSSRAASFKLPLLSVDRLPLSLYV